MDSTVTRLDFAVDADFMFSNRKHVHKPRIEKRQRKLLAKLPDLEGFLRPQERVMLVTTCVSPTPFFEQWTTGWMVFYLNRALLVVTDQRLLHVPTTPSYGYRGSIAQIELSDCAEIRIRGRHMLVRYRNGSKERFLYLGGERGKLKEHFKTLHESVPPADRSAAGRVHLCPRCTAPQKPGVYQCNGCRLEFKDLGTAVRLSALLPGGGYFYTGHWLLGLGDALVEGILLLLLLSSLADGLDGAPGAYGAAVIFGIVLLIEKLITVYHARRYVQEYLPREQPVRMRKAPTT